MRTARRAESGVSEPVDKAKGNTENDDERLDEHSRQNNEADRRYDHEGQIDGQVERARVAHVDDRLFGHTTYYTREILVKHRSALGARHKTTPSQMLQTG